jgi:hypothetical protein
MKTPARKPMRHSRIVFSILGELTYFSCPNREKRFDVMFPKTTENVRHLEKRRLWPFNLDHPIIHITWISVCFLGGDLFSFKDKVLPSLSILKYMSEHVNNQSLE